MSLRNPFSLLYFTNTECNTLIVKISKCIWGHTELVHLWLWVWTHFYRLKYMARLYQHILQVTFNSFHSGVVGRDNIATFSRSEVSSFNRKLNLTTKCCPPKGEVMPGPIDNQILVVWLLWPDRVSVQTDLRDFTYSSHQVERRQWDKQCKMQDRLYSMSVNNDTA